MRPRLSRLNWASAGADRALRTTRSGAVVTREGAGLDYRAVVRALGLLGGTCKAHPAVEGWVLAFLASPAVEAGRVPCEAVVGVLLSLKAGTVNSILRFLQLLLRAAYAGHLLESPGVRWIHRGTSGHRHADERGSW